MKTVAHGKMIRGAISGLILASAATGIALANQAPSAHRAQHPAIHTAAGPSRPSTGGPGTSPLFPGLPDNPPRSN